MQLDLHHAVRDAYRQAITHGRTSREAFEAASDLVSANTPYLVLHAARRLAAEMLCREPDPSIISAEKANENQSI